jgi:hypothetical protein
MLGGYHVISNYLNKTKRVTFSRPDRMDATQSFPHSIIDPSSYHPKTPRHAILNVRQDTKTAPTSP